MTTTTNEAKVESRDVQAGAHRLRVYTCGDPTRPAVLFVHGSGPGVSAPSNWSHLMPDFAADYFCIAPDVLGFGDSEHPDPAPTGGMAEYTDLRARTLLALLDEFGIEQAHFVGNSMGGMISLRVAQIAPERIDRLILMGSGGAPIPPTEDLIKLVTFYQEPSAQTMADLLVRFVDDPDLFEGRLDEIARDRFAQASRPEVRRSHLATFNPEHAPVKYSEEESGGDPARDPGAARPRGPDASGAGRLLPGREPAECSGPRPAARGALDPDRAGRPIHRAGEAVPRRVSGFGRALRRASPHCTRGARSAKYRHGLRSGVRRAYSALAVMSTRLTPGTLRASAPIMRSSASSANLPAMAALPESTSTFHWRRWPA